MVIYNKEYEKSARRRLKYCILFHLLFYAKSTKADTRSCAFLFIQNTPTLLNPENYESFQISSLYCAMVLSDEKNPALLILTIIFCAHPLRFSYASYAFSLVFT